MPSIYFMFRIGSGLTVASKKKKKKNLPNATVKFIRFCIVRKMHDSE